MFEASGVQPDHGYTVGWAAIGAAPATAQSLAALTAVDCSSLPGAALIDAIQAAEKALSLLAAIQIRLLAALAKPFVAGDPLRLAARLARKSCMTGDEQSSDVHMFVADAAVSLASAEVAAALRISPVTAGIRVREAGRMTTVLAPTLKALENGTLDRGKARVISEHCEPLQPEHSAMVQQLVLPSAGGITTSELRDITGQAVITVDPQGSEDRHKAAAARRDLALTALPDAMATLKAFLPAEGAVKIFQVSDLLATATAGNDGDARGIGARRVDALVDIADHLLTHGHLDLSHYLGKPLPDHGIHAATECTDTNSPEPQPPRGVLPDVQPIAPRGHRTSLNVCEQTISTVPPTLPAPHANSSTARRSMTKQGRRPHLTVVIGLETLAGLNDLPARLAGFGSITAGVARSIAASAATITSAVADSGTGTVVEVGSLQYRPKQDLRDQIAALHTKCQFPSCRQPVWRCDIDHREPFDHEHPDRGGATTVENTAPFCRRHHLFKHHSEWQVRPDPDAHALNWISPTGHRYRTGRDQVIPPELWVITAAGKVAGQLDIIVTTGEVSPKARHQDCVEESLASLLLQHQLNRRPMEYVSQPDVWRQIAGAAGADAGRSGSAALDAVHLNPDGLDARHLYPDDDSPPF